MSGWGLARGWLPFLLLENFPGGSMALDWMAQLGVFAYSDYSVNIAMLGMS